MERVHKILARAGIASRRASEELIRQGRVTVNGTQAQIGSQADLARDDIRLDGQRIGPPPTTVWIVLNKPRGVVVSDRAQGSRPIARDLVSHPGRMFAVGRLDVDSEGLVLLTNDGGSAERLSHPRYEHDKEYRVLLNRSPDNQQLELWSRGLVLADGYRTRPAWVRREAGPRSDRWVRVVLKEGHKRQIRESARALGLRVERLIRIRLGPFLLDDLKPGEWRLATAEETAGIDRPAAGSGRGAGRVRAARSSSVPKERG